MLQKLVIFLCVYRPNGITSKNSLVKIDLFTLDVIIFSNLFFVHIFAMVRRGTDENFKKLQANIHFIQFAIHILILCIEKSFSRDFLY